MLLKNRINNKNKAVLCVRDAFDVWSMLCIVYMFVVVMISFLFLLIEGRVYLFMHGV